MATVTRENIGLLNDRITVTVTQDDYIPVFEKALKQYAKSANIPGFRKGMVPSGMIKKMHGPSVFNDEVLKTIESKLSDYLVTEKIDIFAHPLPASEAPPQLDMNNPQAYSFNFEIGLKPNFDLPDPGTLPLVEYDVEVTDQMVEEEVDKMRLRLGKMTEPETAQSDDTVLNVQFQPVSPDGTVAEDAPAKDNSLLLKYFSEGYRPKLIGSKKDDSFQFQLSEAFDDRERDWIIKDLGLDASDPNAAQSLYKMTITKLGFVEKRELDEAFFKEAYPHLNIASADEFRQQLRSEIEQHWKAQSRNYLQHELYHVLLDNTHIEVPEGFLKKWLRTSGDRVKSEDEVENEFPVFRDQLKWTLISDKVARENNLEVSMQEVRESLKQQLLGYFGNVGLSQDEGWLNDYLNRIMKDEQQVQGTYRRLESEKILGWAAAKVNPTRKTVSVADFQEMQQEHAHHAH